MKRPLRTKTGTGLDPIEAMILKEGLRIADVLPYKELDLLAIVLNSGDVLQARLSDFERLKKASEAQLKKWRLIGGGMASVGRHWMKTSLCAGSFATVCNRRPCGG